MTTDNKPIDRQKLTRLLNGFISEMQEYPKDPIGAACNGLVAGVLTALVEHIESSVLDADWIRDRCPEKGDKYLVLFFDGSRKIATWVAAYWAIDREDVSEHVDGWTYLLPASDSNGSTINYGELDAEPEEEKGDG
jgi:hypothetical protein